MCVGTNVTGPVSKPRADKSDGVAVKPLLEGSLWAGWTGCEFLQQTHKSKCQLEPLMKMGKSAALRKQMCLPPRLYCVLEMCEGKNSLRQGHKEDTQEGHGSVCLLVPGKQSCCRLKGSLVCTGVSGQPWLYSKTEHNNNKPLDLLQFGCKPGLFLNL